MLKDMTVEVRAQNLPTSLPASLPPSLPPSLALSRRSHPSPSSETGCRTARAGVVSNHSRLHNRSIYASSYIQYVVMNAYGYGQGLTHAKTLKSAVANLSPN